MKQQLFFYGRWALIGLISLIFLWSAYLEVTGKMSARFHDWGYPGWSPMIIGAAEILAVVGLYFKRFQGWATFALAVIAAGAALTVVGHHEKWIRSIKEGWMTPIPSILVLLAITGIMYLNAHLKKPE